MREGAEVAVLAGAGVLAVGLAELALVSTGVVELLDLVVGLVAVAVDSGAGDVVIMLEVGPPPVLVVVEVQAHLSLMRVYVATISTFPGAGLGLEGIDVEAEVIAKREVEVVLVVQPVALEVVVAVVVVGTLLGLVDERVEVLLVDIMKVGALERRPAVGVAIAPAVDVRQVEKGMVEVGIAPAVLAGVEVVAELLVMLLVERAFGGLIALQKLFDSAAVPEPVQLVLAARVPLVRLLALLLHSDKL